LTQVAATLDKGEQQPVIFETEREFVVTSRRLVTIAVKDNPAGKFDDYSSILDRPALEAVPMLHGGQLMEHHLYIDLALPSPPPAIQRLRLAFDLEPAGRPSGNWLTWEIWNGTTQSAIPLAPSSDATDQLTRSGEIVFALESLPEIPQTETSEIKGFWLRCRTTVALTPGARVPVIRGIAVHVESARKDLKVEAALSNSVVLDTTKDFFPFGRQPDFGDTFYLANAEALSKANATVTLHFLTNPEAGGGQTPVAAVSRRSVRLRWELWDGAQWVTAGISESGRPIRDNETGFSDDTKALTASGVVTVRIPPTTAPLQMAGLKSFWLRVRIVGGDYGHAAAYERGHDGTFIVTPASFTPPVISVVSIDYALNTTSAPGNILTYNDFTVAKVNPQASTFLPFQPPDDTGAHCYFGFAPTKAFSDRSMSIYLGVGNPSDRTGVLNMSLLAHVSLLWEYWNGSAWTKWTVIDDTDAFRRSGTIRFLATRDFSPKSEFGSTRYWLRVSVLGDTGFEPLLRLVAMNTTMASQCITLTSEVLGSSNGTPGQRFRTTHSPVLSGQQLEVLEPAMPSVETQRMIRELEGDDAIRKAESVDPRGSGVWVRWHEVPNFNASGQRDRHYVIDRDRGEVVFGDDVNGRIPVVAPKNIVMARYRIGGGASGNRKAHTIAQLKSSIPYIDQVTNPEPAAGGADAEGLDDLIERAPRQLRHGYRAVTAQDFEDLAMLASSEVARARCISLYDLAHDPDARSPRPGIASLIIAPVASPSSQAERRPMPSMELIRRVQDYLDEHRLPEADLVIVGPEYVAVKIETEITVSDVDTASEVELAVSQALSRFLHPSIGGRDGVGWQFGQEPVRSDLFTLIEGVPGVDHVRELKLTRTEDRPGAYKTGYFLICGAEPVVTATVEN
jgi:hypothetical protein